MNDYLKSRKNIERMIAALHGPTNLCEYLVFTTPYGQSFVHSTECRHCKLRMANKLHK